MRLRSQAELVARADAAIRARSIEPGAALGLAKELIAKLLFGRARLILAQARAITGAPDADRDLLLRLGHKHVLATYKDPDLPARGRLIEAWRILVEVDDPDSRREADLATTQDKGLRQETLGLAGAICKRLWEVDNLRGRLEQSLSYYLRGHYLGCEHDGGYTGINAAFVLDRLAGIEVDLADGVASDRSRERRTQAQAIRRHLVTVLPPLEHDAGNRGTWWFPATLAEAFFGLGDYALARSWAAQCAARENTPEWERESTARQIVALARALRLPEAQTLAGFLASPAGDVVRTLLGGEAAAAGAVASTWIGRVGLALSGGGFRASLFHIGVLARLAELDALRHIEVLSCVSGGSIVGAHYYLEMRRLLHAKDDQELGQSDYIEVVENLQRDFLAGVQRNLRMRVIGSFPANVRMLASTTYSRTNRLGELYEKHLYSRVQDGEGSGARWLGRHGTAAATSSRADRRGADIFVTPKAAGDDFHPKRDNWRRKNKVPVLLLNATALNTGHNWQFSASWMGEPPASEIDMNERLRRKYYDQSPARRVRLGHAVGASSCVPGLFEPIVMDSMYEHRTVRLVDGGTHDNQGVFGLLEQDCDVVLISDASGQMTAQRDPSRGVIGVPLRANSILMARVRDAQFEDLKARRRSGLLRGMLFLHLKQGLDVESLDWIGCDDAWAKWRHPPVVKPDTTSYGVRKDIQALLAAMRTDLDSFSEVEAYSLMTSGYLMTDDLFRQHMVSFPAHDVGPRPWTFLALRPAMQGGHGHGELRRQLDVSAKGAFKVWYLCKPLQALAVVLAVATVVGSIWATWRWWDYQFPIVRWGAGVLASIAVVALFGATVKELIWVRQTVTRWFVGLGLAAVGWLVVAIHVAVFDRLFLRIGKARRVTGP